MRDNDGAGFSLAKEGVLNGWLFEFFYCSIIFFGSAPARLLQPGQYQVNPGSRVIHNHRGTPAKKASRVTPPESVMISRLFISSRSISKYPTGSNIITFSDRAMVLSG